MHPWVGCRRYTKNSPQFLTAMGIRNKQQSLVPPKKTCQVAQAVSRLLSPGTGRDSDFSDSHTGAWVPHLFIWGRTQKKPLTASMVGLRGESLKPKNLSVVNLKGQWKSCIGGDENVLLSLERWLYTDKILTGHNNWIPKYFPLVLVGFYEKDENINRLDPFSGKRTLGHISWPFPSTLHPWQKKLKADRAWGARGC